MQKPPTPAKHSTQQPQPQHNNTKQNKTKRALAFLCLFALHRRSQIHTKKPANTSTANDTEHNDTDHRRHMQLHTATTATTQQHKTKQNALFLFLVCFLSTDVAKSTQRSQPLGVYGYAERQLASHMRFQNRTRDMNETVNLIARNAHTKNQVI